MLSGELNHHVLTEMKGLETEVYAPKSSKELLVGLQISPPDEDIVQYFGDMEQCWVITKHTL